MVAIEFLNSCYNSEQSFCPCNGGTLSMFSMFYSGKGSLNELASQGENVATSGRRYMWQKMGAAVDEEYLAQLDRRLLRARR